MAEIDIKLMDKCKGSKIISHHPIRPNFYYKIDLHSEPKHLKDIIDKKSKV